MSMVFSHVGFALHIRYPLNMKIPGSEQKYFYFT